MATMRRRNFLGVLGGAAAWPLAARAQQPSKTMKRMALVDPSDKITDMIVANPIVYGALFKELGRLGYVEGHNLVVERYSANGQTDHFDELARDVVSTHPDVIRSASTRLALAFKKYTATIPIVAMGADPVALGLVSSLARPGGNITGISVDAGIEIWGKRLGLLLEAIQKPSNVQFLASRDVWKSAEGRAVRDAAKLTRISVTGALLDGAIDEFQYRRVFAAMEQDRVDALMVSDQPEHRAHRQLIVNLAARSKIPTIYPYLDRVALGGLMAYGVDINDLTRQSANMIGEILKGTNPADMPFYQPTKFQLAINVKTAKALGLEIPAALLLRADEVIE